MQKLQGEHGVNPVGGCLPMLVQIPVFIGLFHVLREFQPYKMENYVFGRAEVVSFNDASIFGAKLGASVIPYHGALPLTAYHTTTTQMLTVMIPLMLAAGFFTHLTARHSVARQTEAQMANPQAAIMNKLTLYVFPVGVVVGAPFLPLAILFYWVANNLWTLGQQRVVYTKIEQEEAEKKTRKVETSKTLAPKVGKKPDPTVRQKKPGAKPVVSGRPARPASSASASSPGSNGTNGSAGSNGSTNGASNGASNGAANGGSAGGSTAGGQRNGRPTTSTKRGRKR